MDNNNLRGCYVLFDAVAEEAGPIFDAKNDAIAVRLSLPALADATFVRDIRLLKVAEIDPSTGQVNVIYPVKDVHYNTMLDAYMAQLRFNDVLDKKEVVE